MRLVMKFGGTSMADSGQMRKVIAIIEKRDPIAVIVSAPGKRHPGDTKVTDLLLEYSRTRNEGLMLEFAERVRKIEDDFGIGHDVSEYVSDEHAKWKTVDEIASRGEHVSGLLMSRITGRIFIDPFPIMEINGDSLSVTEESYRALSEAIGAPGASGGYVVPGFYGKGPDGGVKTFTRGGSDTTGSVVAKAIGADLYENWTDVSGVFNANPKSMACAKPIPRLSYSALRAMAENGTEVFCRSAIAPVENIIPIRIKNTNNPDDPGTMIIKDADIPPSEAEKFVAITVKNGRTIAVRANGSIRDFGEEDAMKVFKSIFG